MKTAAILFSGGKDSCLALLKAKQQGYNIKYLLTILPTSQDSWMWHKPSLALLKAQAAILEIPLVVQKSSTEKEKEVKDLEKLLKKVEAKVRYLITGGIASIYQKERIEKIAKKLNLNVISPLWGFKPEKIWEEAFKHNFKIILTKVCCEGLDRKLLGKIIDKDIFKVLIERSKKYNFNLDLEGGEAETAVLDMPLFSKEIALDYNIKSQGQYRHFIKIRDVRFKDKKKKSNLA